jgi:hypothetical protein
VSSFKNSSYVTAPGQAAPEFVDVEKGAPLVALGENPKRCMALVKHDMIGRTYRCERYAREWRTARFRCCSVHKSLEFAARQLRPLAPAKV